MSLCVYPGCTGMGFLWLLQREAPSKGSRLSSRTAAVLLLQAEDNSSSCSHVPSVCWPLIATQSLRWKLLEWERWFVIYVRPVQVIIINSLVLKTVTLVSTFGTLSWNLFWTETGGWAESHEAVIRSLLVLAPYSQRVALNSSVGQQRSWIIISKQTWIPWFIFFLSLSLIFTL